MKRVESVQFEKNVNFFLIYHSNVFDILEQGTRNDIEMEEEMQSNLGNDASQKIPYPARVFFILANEFCERFAFYGLVGAFSESFLFCLNQLK